jgi:hypothetical protein
MEFNNISDFNSIFKATVGVTSRDFRDPRKVITKY